MTLFQLMMGGIYFSVRGFCRGEAIREREAGWGGERETGPICGAMWLHIVCLLPHSLHSHILLLRRIVILFFLCTKLLSVNMARNGMRRVCVSVNKMFSMILLQVLNISSRIIILRRESLFISSLFFSFCRFFKYIGDLIFIIY